MICYRCNQECTEKICDNCGGKPLLEQDAEKLEIKVRDIDVWIASAVKFRKQTLENLETLMRSFPDYRELRGIKVQAYAYWVARIKTCLAGEGYEKEINTNLAITVRSLFDEIDIEWNINDDVFDMDYHIETVIKNIKQEFGKE